MDKLSEQSKRILSYIRQLAKSRGFYGRLRECLESDYEAAEKWLSRFHWCRDEVDFVIAVES